MKQTDRKTDITSSLCINFMYFVERTHENWKIWDF